MSELDKMDIEDIEDAKLGCDQISAPHQIWEIFWYAPLTMVNSWPVIPNLSNSSTVSARIWAGVRRWITGFSVLGGGMGIERAGVWGGLNQ